MTVSASLSNIVSNSTNLSSTTYSATTTSKTNSANFIALGTTVLAGIFAMLFWENYFYESLFIDIIIEFNSFITI